jgi:secondary thiamine-phosphate synthase enzyme
MIEIKTRKRVEVIDITDRVLQALQESGTKNGICLVYSLHTTTGLAVNEADSALINDIRSLLQRIVPEAAGYEHDRGDGNAHAHLQAVMLGNSVVVPALDGRLVLGTWQRILFFELDGPRKRTVSVRVVPS